MPEVRLGLMPGIGGTQRLPRVVGLSAAKDLIFSGRTVTAPDALELGLVDEVVDTNRACLARAKQWAAQFGSLPAWSIRWAKQAIDTGMQDDLASGLLIEAAGFSALFGTEERRHRTKDFLAERDNRAPRRG